MFASLVLIVLGAIWGASYMFIKIGGAEIPPFTFVEGRTLIAALALLVVLRLRGERLPRTRREWFPLILMGITNGVIPYTLITWGETHITSGLAAILNATTTLFTVFLAHFWAHDERLTVAKVLGACVGFAGVIVIFVPELNQGVHAEFWGQFAIVAASASYAVAAVAAHKYLGGVSHVVAAAGQLSTAALIMLPLSLLFDHPFQLHPSAIALGSLTVLALLGTAFAYVLYYWLVEHTGATRTAMVTYLLPFAGLMWGALLLNESFGWEAIIGLALIISGVAWVNRPEAVELHGAGVPAAGN